MCIYVHNLYIYISLAGLIRGIAAQMRACAAQRRSTCTTSFQGENPLGNTDIERGIIFLGPYNHLLIGYHGEPKVSFFHYIRII